MRRAALRGIQRVFEMTAVLETTLTPEQISVWLRGLFAIAWADGHFDPEEQETIAELTQQELAPKIDLGPLEPITPEELAAVLGKDPRIAENFLRTAVMVALADGVYSTSEDEKLHQFCQALGQKVEALEALRHTLYNSHNNNHTCEQKASVIPPAFAKHHLDLLAPIKHWLDGLEIHDPRLARFLCKMIPSQCPFERDIILFGRKVVHIPPLCKLNPLYEQLVGLRFRALSYLADKCGEDVTPYC
ncbi:MAG: nitrogenase [Oscillatoriaceae bacterium SKW80]|nr:nitrogenase [Oscillatoriaceae bacterium SKYG93]MCX8122246.1 nitrogenase [Oscillatoriaceae bacterium SKW80]MDW8454532.1 Mo-dependent nitrogenase C-terminal domain-containing protein [Oscillatoriaceae cyanobacterium SKYGB_i_bin93]